VSNLKQEEFERLYQQGKDAMMSGEYRLSIESFEQATNFIALYSRTGGELQMWLVEAYQAAGESQQAITLCQELITHPHRQIREQSKNLLYILKAPRLQRPQEWMTQLPDFNNLSENQTPYLPSSPKTSVKPKRQIEPIDLNEVNTNDNQFLWFGLLLILLTIIGVVYF
jgi:tetratricopeptide (TPR) repeat protein